MTQKLLDRIAYEFKYAGTDYYKFRVYKKADHAHLMNGFYDDMKATENRDMNRIINRTLTLADLISNERIITLFAQQKKTKRVTSILLFHLISLEDEISMNYQKDVKPSLRRYGQMPKRMVIYCVYTLPKYKDMELDSGLLLYLFRSIIPKNEPLVEPIDWVFYLTGTRYIDETAKDTLRKKYGFKKVPIHDGPDLNNPFGIRPLGFAPDNPFGSHDRHPFRRIAPFLTFDIHKGVNKYGIETSAAIFQHAIRGQSKKLGIGAFHFQNPPHDPETPLDEDHPHDSKEKSPTNQIGFGPGNTYDSPICQVCGVFTTNLFTCGSCKRAIYCSNSCQKEDWDIHSEMCQ